MSLKNTLLCFLISLSAIAQKPLNFADMLTYEYVQEGQKKEFSVYLDRKTSTWLLTNADSFGGTAEGVELVVAYPNGKYLVCGIDDAGQKFCQTFDSPLARKNTPKISGKALGKSRVFGQNNYGWPTFKGQLYQLNAGRMTQELYAATVSFDCRPLYAYNFLLGIEHYLPVFQKIDYPSYLSKNQLILSEQSPLNIKLLSVSPTEYFVNLSEYKRIK